jgi:hypothetical protein
MGHPLIKEGLPGSAGDPRLLALRERLREGAWSALCHGAGLASLRPAAREILEVRRRRPPLQRLALFFGKAALAPRPRC